MAVTQVQKHIAEDGTMFDGQAEAAFYDEGLVLQQDFKGNPCAKGLFGYEISNQTFASTYDKDRVEVGLRLLSTAMADPRIAAVMSRYIAYRIAQLSPPI